MVGLKLVLQAVSALLALWFGLVYLDYDRARVLQAYGGFYLCAAVALSLGWFAWRALRPAGWRAFIAALRRERTALLLAAGLTGLMLLHEPTAMRIFGDEPTHLLTARMMAVEQITATPAEASAEGGGFQYRSPFPVYRMYFYPFLVALGHMAAGLSAAVPYVVNGVLCFLLLFLAQVLGRNVARDRRGGPALAILLAGTPLLVQTVNSAAYDVTNLVALAVAMLAGLRYARLPGAQGLDLAVAAGLFLAYSRSESILFFLGPGLLFVYKSLRERRIEVTAFSIAAPLLLVGPFAARAIWKASNRDLTDYYPGAESGFFGLEYLPVNLERVGSWLVSTAPGDLNPLFLVLLAAVSIPLALLVCLRRADDGDAAVGALLVAFGGAFAVHSGMVLLLFWDPTHPSAQRFFLPLFLYLAVAVVWASARIGRRTGARASRWVLFAAALNLWLVALPKAARAEATHGSISGEYARRSLDWVRRHDDGRTLYVTSSVTSLLRLHDYPAVETSAFNGDPGRAGRLIGAGLFDRVVLLESRIFEPGGSAWGVIGSHVAPSPDLEMELLARERGFLYAELNIHEVTGYRAEGRSRRFADSPPDDRRFDSDVELYNHIRSLRYD